jgi:hypothetical protein
VTTDDTIKLHSVDAPLAPHSPSSLCKRSSCKRIIDERLHPIHSRPSYSFIQKLYTSHSQFQTFFNHSSHCSLINFTPHIRSLKQFSIIYKATILSRHMKDEDSTIKVHGREIKIYRVKLGEALKLVHFQVSRYIFFLCFWLTLAF